MNKITAAVLVVCLLAAGTLAATSTVAAAGAVQQEQGQNGTITVATEQTDETLVVTLSASGELAGYHGEPDLRSGRGAVPRGDRTRTSPTRW